MNTISASALDDLRLSFVSMPSTVGRSNYLKIGFSLAAVKYAIEFAVVLLITGEFFSPLEFVNPWLSSKASFLVDRDGGVWIGAAWILFTLPFVWVAIAMSVRRAADVGITPWCGLLVLFPIINLVVMGTLGILPSGLLSSTDTLENQHRQELIAEAYQPPPPTIDDVPRPNEVIRCWQAVLVGCCVQVAIGGLSVWVLQTYGFILFFATPAIAGAASGYVFNRDTGYSLGNNIVVIGIMNFLSFFVMLFVGIDGAICLLMAFPLLIPLSVLGGMIGRMIGVAGLRDPNNQENRGLTGILIFLPLTLALESLDSDRPLHRVSTIVEIDAPIDEVWSQVIAFPEISSPPAWYFRAGIAAPIRSRIEGTGVGACRYCEFTTGPFVEPITVWDAPHELSFDVVSQPHPMREWSPIPGIHPPHLDHGLRSERGQFLLESLANGATRITGTTWYRIDVRPRLYWKIWSDAVIHGIHRRVLEHIRDQAEHE